jgi:hypothetical protein
MSGLIDRLRLPGERIAGMTAASGDQFSIVSGSFSSRRRIAIFMVLSAPS